MVEVVPSVVFIAQIGNQPINDYRTFRSGTGRVTLHHSQKLLTMGVFFFIQIDIVAFQNDTKLEFASSLQVLHNAGALSEIFFLTVRSVSFATYIPKKVRNKLLQRWLGSFIKLLIIPLTAALSSGSV